MNFKKILVILLAISFLAGAYVWFFVYNKSHTDFQRADSAFVGEANSLLEKAVQDNGAFMEAYMNQAVEVTGEVGEVGTQSFTLGTGMICTLDPNLGQILPSSGAVVKVKGRVVGIDEDILTGDIICNLDNCTFIDE